MLHYRLQREYAISEETLPSTNMAFYLVVEPRVDVADPMHGRERIAAGSPRIVRNDQYAGFMGRA